MYNPKHHATYYNKSAIRHPEYMKFTSLLNLLKHRLNINMDPNTTSIIITNKDTIAMLLKQASKYFELYGADSANCYFNSGFL